MKIRLNEKLIEAAIGTTLSDVAQRYKPGADVRIVNGFPAPDTTILREGDEVCLITRGEIPPEDELEYLMTARHTPGVHTRLKSARVGIAGVGGLGSAVAVSLARAGIGTLVIADFDVVEPSNLNRQQYFIDQLGCLKVEALAENLARINPYVTVIPHPVLLTPENIPTVFSDCCVIVEAFDRADMKAMLTQTILENMYRSTVVAASGVAGYGPNNTITTRRAATRLFLVGDGCSEAQPGNGLMAPRVGIAAGHQANQVLRIILGEET